MAVVTTALRRALPRVGGALVVLFTVATLAFIALQFIPGGPAEAALGGPGSQASAAALEAARAAGVWLYRGAGRRENIYGGFRALQKLQLVAHRFYSGCEEGAVMRPLLYKA